MSDRFSILFMIPGLVCLFWVAVHCLLSSKTNSFKTVVLLLSLMFLATTAEILISYLTDSESLARLVILFAAPSVIPLTCVYFSGLHNRKTRPSFHVIWTAVPVSLLTAGTILTALHGFSETDKLIVNINSNLPLHNSVSLTGLDFQYFLWTYLIYRAFLALEFLYLLIYIIVLSRKLHFSPKNILRFLSRERKVRVLEIQVCIVIALAIIASVMLFSFRTAIYSSSVATAIIVIVSSVLVFLFGFFALFGAKLFISTSDIRTALRFNYTQESRSQVSEAIIMDMSEDLYGDALTHVLSRLDTQGVPGDLRSHETRSSHSLVSAVFNAVTRSWEEGSLISRFQHLMIDEQLFLHPGLTLSDVAERLNTNKTYISKTVNQTYNLGFPELLNILRVDYAEKYIRSHEKATQEEIAKASGFFSASAFNSTFKRITGYTPKVWTARKDSAGQ